MRLGWLSGAALLVVSGMALACAGLESSVQGTSITIDGQAWAVESCQSGAVFSFEGIQLNGVDGRRVRLQSKPDGTANVIVMDAGSAVGKDLGACAQAAFETTGLTVNNVVGLAGGGSIACEGEVKVSGTVAVDRCATPLF